MELLTTGKIAKQLNVDRDMVSYALRKLKIKPNSRAGQVRIFSESALVAVKKFLNSRIERKVCNV